MIEGKKVIQHLDWLLEKKLINILQYSKAREDTEIQLVVRQFNETGFNRREEYDR